MRLPRVVARAALIAALASVVVSGLVGSRIPSAPAAIDPATFREVTVARSGTSMTTPQLDPILASAGSLAADALLREPLAASRPGAPRADGGVTPAKVIVKIIWYLDNNISWYGPGLYGREGACSLYGADGLQPDDVGVAHRTLPCGTKVTFRYNGRTVTTQVVDRGPYVSGRIWDMTKGLCTLLAHCFTGGGVYWQLD